MVADGNCGFRALAHTIPGQESVRPEIRQRLDHLNSGPAGCLRDVPIAPGAEIPLQCLQASLLHFVGPIRDHSKRFDSGKHAQLAAVAYDIFIVMVTYDNSNVVVRRRALHSLLKRLGQQSP